MYETQVYIILSMADPKSVKARLQPMFGERFYELPVGSYMGRAAIEAGFENAPATSRVFFVKTSMSLEELLERSGIGEGSPRSTGFIVQAARYAGNTSQTVWDWLNS